MLANSGCERKSVEPAECDGHGGDGLRDPVAVDVEGELGLGRRVGFKRGYVAGAAEGGQP